MKRVKGALCILLIITISFGQMLNNLRINSSKFELPFSDDGGFDLSFLKSMGLDGLTGKGENTHHSPAAITGFDEEIDPDKYIIGTGDGLTIYFWGTVNDQITTVVDPEGNIVIPSIGIVKVKNLTLTQCKSLVKKTIQKKYKKAQMSVILSKIRSFKIYILGDVTSPGFTNVKASTRVSDVIYTLGSMGLVDSTRFVRKVLVHNKIHGTRLADLALFNHSNIIDKNPYLIEGDRVFVEKRNDVLSVYGAVNYPNTYDFITGDNLETVLAAAGGFTREANSQKVEVYRFLNNVDSLKTYILDYNAPSSKKFVLEKDDRIVVRAIPNYRKRREVKITGEVYYPGVYPIREGKTTLRDILKLAGGFTDNASLNESKVVRGASVKQHEGSLSTVQGMAIQEMISTQLKDLNLLEKGYYKDLFLEENGRVSVNFNLLINNSIDVYNITVQNGDHITIGKKTNTIKVMGAVIHPGLVTYKEGANIDYYIQQAGGFTDRAKKRSVRIVKAGTTNLVRKRVVQSIKSGDTIWVPERATISPKDVLAITGSVVGITAGIFSIANSIKDLNND